MGGYDRRPTRDDTDVIGKRIGAAIVDSIVMVVIMFAFVLVGVGAAFESGVTGGGFELLITVFGSIVGLAYYFLLEGFWDGQTVGKRLLGIKVVRETGEECDVGAAMIRNFLRIVDGLFYYAVGFAFMAMSDRRQRLGDRVAGTVVVEEAPEQAAGPQYEESWSDGRTRGSSRSRRQ